MTVRDDDRGYRDLVWRVFQLNAPKISVGVHEEDGAEQREDSDLRVIDIAQIHEFGLGVPERSFIRAWFDANEPKAKEALTRLLNEVVLGKLSANAAIEQFALWCVGGIQQRMANGIPPPLSPITIDRKGSSVPLINTGQLRSSISYEIQDADGNVTKKGTSDRKKELLKRAKQAKRDLQKEKRKEERARAKERKAVRNALKKRVKKTIKSAKKNVRKSVKKTIKSFKGKPPRKSRKTKAS